MPNWTYNSLEIKGESTALQNIVDKFISIEKRDSSNEVIFDFNNIIPEPKVESECDPKFIRKEKDHVEVLEERPWFNWYEWRYANWGTKWNACDCSYSLDDGVLKIYFNTAWCPVIKLMLKFSTMLKDVEIIYNYIEEQGAEYVGTLTLLNGEVVSSNEPSPWSKEAYELMFEFWDNKDDYFYSKKEDSYVSYYAYEYDYNEFCDKWYEEHSGPEFEGMEPPCIEEWYENDMAVETDNSSLN